MKAPLNNPQAKEPEKGLLSFFKHIGQMLADIFKPEEVEVTFQDDGKSEKYTYTLVHHKQVA